MRVLVFERVWGAALPWVGGGIALFTPCSACYQMSGQGKWTFVVALPTPTPEAYAIGRANGLKWVGAWEGGPVPAAVTALRDRWHRQ